MKKLIQTLQQLTDRKELSKSNKQRVQKMIINAKMKNEKK